MVDGPRVVDVVMKRDEVDGGVVGNNSGRVVYGEVLYGVVVLDGLVRGRGRYKSHRGWLRKPWWGVVVDRVVPLVDGRGVAGEPRRGVDGVDTRRGGVVDRVVPVVDGRRGAEDANRDEVDGRGVVDRVVPVIDGRVVDVVGACRVVQIVHGRGVPFRHSPFSFLKSSLISIDVRFI